MGVELTEILFVMFRRASSSDDQDEEPLLTLPRVPSGTRYQKPPACGVCCNTKCGSYFITALQMAFGIAVMLSAIYSNGPRVGKNESEEEEKAGYLAYVLRRETVFLWGLLVILISSMTFKGISTNQHKLLTPTILLQYVHLIITIAQTVVTILYWTTLQVSVRTYLTQMIVEVDHEIDQDQDVDEISKQQWSEIEKLVKDDENWSELSPKILYLVTMFHTGQIIIGAWIIWTLLNHKKWLMSRSGGFLDAAVIVRSSDPRVVIQK